ncbi:MAG: hypothetical protein QXI33_02530 [Candidatus Pacearchaeota archaeon]
MTRSFQSGTRYFLAFIIGTLAFILVFVIAYSISYIEYQRISNLQSNLAYSIFEDKISYSFFGIDICSDDSYKRVSEDLGFQGRIIDDLEKKFGKNDAQVLLRKKFYTLVLLEHFEFVNERNRECDTNIHTILFFYSNKEEYGRKSENIGRILGYISEQYGDLVIYSFDTDLDSPLVSMLKDKYNIERPVELIIDGSFKVSEVNHVNDIEKYLK